MQPASSTTIAEYVALESASDIRHELVGGHIVAMAGAAPRHNAIGANIASELRVALRGKGSRPYGSSQRVHVLATGLDTYPDITVVCGAIIASPDDALAATNPTLLVEVLSPSTESYDRGAKWQHYQHIPTLREYLLVSAAEPRFERFFLGDDGIWRYELVAAPAESVALGALGIRLSLAESFAGMMETLSSGPLSWYLAS